MRQQPEDPQCTTLLQSPDVLGSRKRRETHKPSLLQTEYESGESCFKVFIVCLFILDCAGSSELQALFSSWGEGASHCRGVSHCGARALESRLRCPHNMWGLPRSGTELVSAAVVGRFLATGPSGSPAVCLGDDDRSRRERCLPPPGYCHDMTVCHLL